MDNQTATTASSSENSRSDYNTIARWVINHDNSTLFNVLYIGLAIVLSIWLGLFWLVAVVAVHGLLEIHRQYLLSKSWKFALFESLWEIKLDLGLIVFAFWLALYLDFIFGMAGLSAGARVVAQTSGRVARAGTRVAIWERIIRGFFITIDDVGLAMKMFVRRKKEGRPSETATSFMQYHSLPQTSWRGNYSKGDCFSIGFLALFAMLILLAPWLTSQGIGQVWQTLMCEMRPF